MVLMSRAGIVLTIVALAAPANAQANRAAGGPFARTAVLNAPFSADATTIFRETLPDGRVRDHTVNTHYYRDSQGRVRAEVETAWGPYVIVQIADIPSLERPASYHPFYMLDLGKRTYRNATYGFATDFFNGEGRVALPVGKVCFQKEPPDFSDTTDDERLRVVGAQVSPDLGIVIASHRSAPLWSVDYEVTNIRRSEPPAELFELTAYTFVSGSRDDPLVTYVPWQSPQACKPVKR